MFRALMTSRRFAPLFWRESVLPVLFRLSANIPAFCLTAPDPRRCERVILATTKVARRGPKCRPG
jgi:hypothetical protein